MYISLEKIEDQLIKKGSFRIVFLGDSITSAEWIHPNWREMVEYVLKEELEDRIIKQEIPSWGIRCFNAGFDGATSRVFLAKLKSQVLNLKPDLVIFIATANDLLFGINLDEHIFNHQEIIESLSSKVGLVVYCTSTSALSDKYNNKYKEYAAGIKNIKPIGEVYGIDLFEEYMKFDLKNFFTLKNRYGTKDLGIKPGDLDYVHPNRLGNAYISKVLLNKIFGIKFNPDKYIESLLKEDMFPEY